jgi:hypothetical protein
VNMIFERREFLDMLTELQTSHATLDREFKAALTDVRRFSEVLRNAEQLEAAQVRRVAADIYKVTERLDDIVEDLLDTEVEGVTVDETAEAEEGMAVAASRTP